MTKPLTEVDHLRDEVPSVSTRNAPTLVCVTPQPLADGSSSAQPLLRTERCTPVCTSRYKMRNPKAAMKVKSKRFCHKQPREDEKAYSIIGSPGGVARGIHHDLFQTHYSPSIMMATARRLFNSSARRVNWRLHRYLPLRGEVILAKPHPVTAPDQARQASLFTISKIAPNPPSDISPNIYFSHEAHTRRPKGTN